MSSDSEEDLPPELRYTTNEVLRAKERNPGMFVSAWQADEENIDRWTQKQLQQDPLKAFIVAAQSGDLNSLRAFLKDRTPKEQLAFLMYSDSDGYTALHRAVYSGHYTCAEFLLEQGASVETRTVDGWTPLHSAVFWNQIACAQLLLEAGSDCNALTNSQQTTLHLAATNNTTAETICFLLGHPGISVENVKNASGDTPRDLLQRNTQLSYLLYPLSDEATYLVPPN